MTNQKKLVIAILGMMVSSMIAFYVVNTLSSGIMVFSAILVAVLFALIGLWMFLKFVRLENETWFKITARWSCLHCIILMSTLMFLLPVFGARDNTTLFLWRMDEALIDKKALYQEHIKQRLYIGMSEEESVKILGNAELDFVYQVTKPRVSFIVSLEQKTGKKIENNSKINLYYTKKMLVCADGIALIFTNGKLKYIIDTVRL